MRVTRLAVPAALVVAAVVVVAVLLLGGNGGHTYSLTFENAGQLVRDNDVQVGGRRVGKVSDIELTEDNQARVIVEVSEPYAPLHAGTTAVIRATSLSGVANRYIALTPAPDSNAALPDGAEIAVDHTTTVVDLDQLFNTLDEPTREGLAKTIRGFSTWYAGKGRQANAAARYLAPALSTTTGLVEKLNADQPALEQLVRDTSSVVATLAARGPQLTDLVSNANTSLGAVADENRSLAEALDLLPATLRRGSTTFVNLRAALGDLDRLVAVSKPATKNLAPFLRDELRPLLGESQPTVAGLAEIVHAPGANNDLTDLLSDAPTLAGVAHTSLRNQIGAFERSIPTVSFLRPYAPELVGFVRDFGLTTANYDANGHFARIAPSFNAFRYDSGTNTLVPVPPSQRLAGLQNGPSVVPRCPGSATQAPPDGSAPWRDTSGSLDCNPAITPPGP